MATIVQTFQAALPMDLFDRLQRVRNRYAVALQAAAKGDYSHSVELGSVSRYVGHILAREARKRPEERGGLRLLDIALAVDRFVPELRGWNQYETLQRQRKQLSGSLSLPFHPAGPGEGNRAS